MTKKAYLVLEDGTVYEGEHFGSDGNAFGEVVFDTSMAGYQEMLTDPSFAGQLLLLTYPLVGNYGINTIDEESLHVQARGLIVREHCVTPSHYQSVETLDEYLNRHGIPGIAGLDTRALTRKLRSSGVMMGMLTSTMEPQQALTELRAMPSYAEQALAAEVGTDSEIVATRPVSDRSLHVVLVDCGVKRSIISHLSASGCHVTVVPIAATARRILELAPDGVLLSPGPGDPIHLVELEAEMKDLLGAVPMMGICLGHQVIARALGATTFKLKFGHHGGNHPVKDLTTGRVYITTQNHGYAVDADSLPDGLQVSHINLNDGTVEGLKHRDLPLISIQYHAEGTPGPRDSAYLFQDFVALMRATQRAA
ncbi:MAG: glutamine-hydrolyzing carbamoyl-phosphate synthase small subunit [Dehalococcoidia bacterium]|nr:glutamine-hydrolyzing carbamoyl-phosphate synthase small subunit [Dehalococcoidia bacterium]